MTFVEAAHLVTLSRNMGLWIVILIGVGAMIGAGIVVLTGITALQCIPAWPKAFITDVLPRG